MRGASCIKSNINLNRRYDEFLKIRNELRG